MCSYKTANISHFEAASSKCPEEIHTFWENFWEVPSPLWCTDVAVATKPVSQPIYFGPAR